MLDLEYEARINQLLKADAWRMKVLFALRQTSLADGWIAAGFIRNMVWDHLSGITPCPPNEDVDILVFQPDDLSWDYENALEDKLKAVASDIPWSVRNQARMHERNGDDVYDNMVHAMAHWLETATSIAVRLDREDNIQFINAYGYDDLFKMILRPTHSGFSKIDQLTQRAHDKGWLARWPQLRYLKMHPAKPYIC